MSKRLTDAQIELLTDKYVLWDRAGREGAVELRDYNRRAAEALKAALSLASEAPPLFPPSTPTEAVLLDMLESLQEGLQTDAGLTKDDRKAMRAQIDALGEALDQVRALPTAPQQEPA